MVITRGEPLPETGQLADGESRGAGQIPQ